MLIFPIGQISSEKDMLGEDSLDQQERPGFAILHVPWSKGNQIPHVRYDRFRAEHMDALKNFIISEGGNPHGCCDLCHMQ
jgi:hypothetical protein